MPFCIKTTRFLVFRVRKLVQNHGFYRCNCRVALFTHFQFWSHFCLFFDHFWYLKSSILGSKRYAKSHSDSRPVFGSILRSFWLPKGYQNRPKAHPGIPRDPPGTPLGAPGPSQAPPRDTQGPPGTILASFWIHLELIWDPFGPHFRSI